VRIVVPRIELQRQVKLCFRFTDPLLISQNRPSL
jgi:hypothetical protein